jgi:hypothetical protein
MPYTNEHAARVREPNEFQQETFRRKTIETGIDIIIGKLKGENTMTIQAYRFDAEKFTPEEAKKWLKEHKIDYISFEAARKKENDLDMTWKFSYNVKDIDQKRGLVTVHANAIGNIDTDGDISMPGSFNKTINESFNRVKWFLNHDRTQLLGVPIEAKEIENALQVTGQLNLKKQIARDTLEDYILYSENGKTLEHSIGVQAVKYEVLEDIPAEYQNMGFSKIRKVSEWKWWEYSTLTSWGANERTPLVSLKNLNDINNTIDWFELMMKGNYSELRLQMLEDMIKILKSLKREPGILNDTTFNEPIIEAIKKSKLFN